MWHVHVDIMYLKFLEELNVGPAVILYDLISRPVGIWHHSSLRRNQHNTADSAVFRGTEDVERAVHRGLQQLILQAAEASHKN